MEHKGPLLQWRLSLAETLSFGITVAVLVFFITEKFQSKEDATKLERRVEKVEAEISQVKDGISLISKDVSYIRGKIENINFKEQR